MNSLRIAAKHFSPLTKRLGFQQISVRNAIIDNRDWMPGKRPETEEERLKAARKYNLLPEEYEPQPDDGLNQGDYPHLPTGHHDTRDPYYPWDYPVFRRNFGEPLPDDFCISTYDKYNFDTHVNHQIHPFYQIIWMTVGVSVVMGIGYILGYKYRYYGPHYGQIRYEKGVTKYEYPEK